MEGDSPCVYRCLSGPWKIVLAWKQLLCCIYDTLAGQDTHLRRPTTIEHPYSQHSLNHRHLHTSLRLTTQKPLLSVLDIHCSIIMRFLSLSTSFAVMAGLGQAIRTVPTSPCADKCGDITNTTSSEIVCKDADYGTPTGQVFAECITCQLGSNATDPSTGDSDLRWLLCMGRLQCSKVSY